MSVTETILDQVLIDFQPLNITFDDLNRLTNSTCSRGKISLFLEETLNLGKKDRDWEREREEERERGREGE